jgi:hypothetical protein
MILTQTESNDLRQQAADIVDQLRRSKSTGQLHMLEIQVKRAVEELEMQDAIRMRTQGRKQQYGAKYLFRKSEPDDYN